MPLSQIIADIVEERYNHSAALVIRATLKSTEAKQMKLSDVRSGLFHISQTHQLRLLMTALKTPAR